MTELPANAELIADAFNTAHRTRRTPSQLADERQELLDALKALLFDSPTDGGVFTSDNITDAVSLYHRLTNKP
jgi:hypothetical protein